MKTNNRIASAVMSMLEIEQLKLEIEKHRKNISKNIFPYENLNGLELAEDAIAILKENGVKFVKCEYVKSQMKYKDIEVNLLIVKISQQHLC